MALPIQKLVPMNNEDFFNGLRSDMSLDYQRRVPEATKANIQNMMAHLTDNRPLYNEFVDALVNRIGLVIGKSMIWSNPLARFKMGMLQYGNTIEEYGMGLLKAHSYEHDREALEGAIFGTEKPEVKASFHKINRENYYKITINENILARAFLETNGLSEFTTKLMQLPATSDAWDEFMLTTQLFNEYEKNDGFYKVNVPDVRAIESDAVAAKAAIRQTRALAENMKFPSTLYNAAGLPTFSQPGELILFATPEYQAAVDVEALAGAFNPGKLDVPTIITIPKAQFNIPGAQAILTDSSFFVIADTKIQMEQARNPVKMHTNYFLHHHGIISASRFAPAVLFTTEAGTESITISTPVTSVTTPKVTDRDNATVTDVKRGEIYNVNASAVTTPANGDNDAVRWSLEGATAPRTVVTQNGVLHVSGTEGASSLTLTATATWTDPEGLSRDGQKATTTVTVSGNKASDWPVREIEAGTFAMLAARIPENQEVDYSASTVDELRGLLTKRGLDSTGVKSVLVERLVAADSAE